MRTSFCLGPFGSEQIRDTTFVKEYVLIDTIFLAC